MNPDVHPITKVDEARLILEARRRNLEAAKVGQVNERILKAREEELEVAEAELAKAERKSHEGKA